VRKRKRSVEKQLGLFVQPLLETQEIAAANCGRTKPPKKSYISSLLSKTEYDDGSSKGVGLR
jgi:hypothetical protein